MPSLRPFPSPSLTVGTDICHIPRVHRLISSPKLFPRFLNRIFTRPERAAFQRRFAAFLDKKAQDTSGDAVDKEQAFIREGIAAHLAGRWAAKEAVIKACTWRKLVLSDVQVLRSERGGGIYGVILDEVKANETYSRQSDALEWSADGHEEEIAATGQQAGDEERSGQIVKVSISHDGEYATAVCLAAEEPAPGDVGGEAAARGML